MSSRQITARLPGPIFEKVQEVTKERGISITDLVVEALMNYFGEEVPGLCMRCHMQNPVEANYCYTCGNPLTPDAKLKQEMLLKISSDPAFIREILDRMDKLLVES